MRRKDLAVGDRVWIVLPYSGGRGWATVLTLGDGYALVRFDNAYRHIFHWEWKTVLYRYIIRKEQEATCSA